MQSVSTKPAPQPLPVAWARLVANSVVTELRATGWRTHKTSRAWNPTGNPRSSYGSAAPVIRSKLLTATETFETVKFVRGAVDPHSVVGVPPLVWTLTVDALGSLTVEGTVAFGDVTNRNRRDMPFRVRRDRRGEWVVAPGSYCTREEREALTTVIAAASVRVVDEDDYWEALHEDFDAATTLELLEGDS